MRRPFSPTAPPGLAAALLLFACAGCYDLVPGPDAFARDGARVEGEDTTAGADAALDGASTGQDVGPEDAAGPDTTVPCSALEPCPPSGDPCRDAVCEDGACALKPRAELSPCDDGDPCTTTYCDAAHACVVDTDVCDCHVSADCKQGKFDDGDPCNGTLYCDTTAMPHKCVVNPATVVSCPATQLPCHENVCEPSTGKCALRPVADTLPPKVCDDGNSCTASDRCKGGQCVTGTNVCTCVKDADCQSKEDGDACNGTLYCDLGAAIPKCVVNPATVVVCPLPQADACATSKCDKATGQCSLAPKPEQSPCDDGNICTQGDVCEKGQCTAGTDLCFCKQDVDCVQFDDGNPCNGVLYCHKPTGKCLVNPKTILELDCKAKGGGACKTEVCAPSSGKCVAKYAQKFTWCNADDNPCTVDDTCDGFGSCTAGTNTCVCEKNEDCASKEDGDLCNGTLYCNKALSPPACMVNPATVVQCDPTGDTDCQHNTCDKKTGKCAVQKVPDLVPCADGDPCTVGDACKGGACDAGPDLCACKVDADCLDDGDLCNGVPWCDTSGPKPQCKVNPKTIVQCDAQGGQGCQQPACEPKSGKCVTQPLQSACDDNNPCTVDLCTSTGDCEHPPAADGTGCGAAKVCSAGACVALPPQMVFVPAGAVALGCNAALDKGCQADEQPQVQVSVSAFFIDRFELTVARYAECVKAGNCLKPADKGPICNWGQATRAQHPVNCIDHAAAKAACVHFGKRLPTEAEWEKAARGGCEVWAGGCAKLTPVYPWALPVANCDMTVMMGATKSGCGLGTTRQVGVFAKDASPYGVRDMGGNVSEWVQDGYTADAWAKAAPLDPVGPPGGGQRVVRGGHLASKAAGVRAGRRQGLAPTAASASLGVRCAMDVPKGP